MSENKKNKKKQPNRFIALTSIAFQMGITIYLGAYFGKKLDLKYNFNKPYFTIATTILAIATSLYSVLKQLNRLNEKK